MHLVDSAYAMYGALTLLYFFKAMLLVFDIAGSSLPQLHCTYVSLLACIASCNGWQFYSAENSHLAIFNAPWGSQAVFLSYPRVLRRAAIQLHPQRTQGCNKFNVP